MSDDAAIVVEGRPDFAQPGWGISRAKKYPPYVFSISRHSALVHRIAHVSIHWWRPKYDCMVRLSKPRLIATTVCGQVKRLEAASSRTCMVPAPEALLCGRCHGEVATFGKDGAATKAGIRRSAAHVKLGCVVNGYPLSDGEATDSHAIEG